MFARTRILQVTGMIVALVLLAACGGVSGGTYTIHANPGEWPWFWPDKAEFIVDKNVYENVPVAGQGRIRLDAVNGEIVITGKPGATSVTVTAELTVGSNVSLRDAENGLNHLGILVSDLPGEILIQTLQPEKLDGRQYLVNYNIHVPSDLSVDVTQVNGHVTVENIENSLLVTVENGSIYGTVTLPPGGRDYAVDGHRRSRPAHPDVDLRRTLRPGRIWCHHLEPPRFPERRANGPVAHGDIGEWSRADRPGYPEREYRRDRFRWVA